MSTLIAHAVVKDGRLKIDLPTDLPAGELDVEVRIPHTAEKPRGTDIAKILSYAGKLEYKGDPMTIQREMRSEWPD